jgi:hypothetical protein
MERIFSLQFLVFWDLIPLSHDCKATVDEFKLLGKVGCTLFERAQSRLLFLLDMVRRPSKRRHFSLAPLHFSMDIRKEFFPGVFFLAVNN